MKYKENVKNIFVAALAFFYTDKYKDSVCQIQAYIRNDIENVGKNLSLLYLK